VEKFLNYFVYRIAGEKGKDIGAFTIKKKDKPSEGKPLMEPVLRNLIRGTEAKTRYPLFGKKTWREKIRGKGGRLDLQRVGNVPLRVWGGERLCIEGGDGPLPPAV